MVRGVGKYYLVGCPTSFQIFKNIRFNRCDIKIQFFRGLVNKLNAASMGINGGNIWSISRGKFKTDISRTRKKV